MKKLFLALMLLLLLPLRATSTEIMVSSYVVDGPNFSLPSGTTTCKLRIYLDRPFVTGGSTGAGRALQAGAPPSSRFYREIIVTIGTRVTPTGDSIPIATIAAFTIDSTTDGVDLKTANYSAFFYTNTGSQLAPFGGFERFKVPFLFDTGVTATWAQIRAYNQSGAPIFISSDTYTKEVIDQKLAAINAISNPMSAMGDLIVGGMSGQPSRLPFSSGATPRFLKQTGTGTITTAFTSLASIDITTALGFTPLNRAGDTMTGLLTLSGDPSTALQAATKQYVDARAGITTLNGLTAGSFPSQTFAVGGNFPNLTITSAAGAHTFNWTGQLAVTRGGTGLATVATGDILYASGANTLSALTAAAAGNALLSGAVPSWGKIGLTTHVSGILPSANGGTGMAFFAVAGPAVLRTFTFPNADATVLTTNAAVTAVQGGTGFSSYTLGDLLYADSGTTLAKRPIGTANKVLTVVAGVPNWALVDLTASVSGTLPLANGGTGQTGFASGFIKSNGSALTNQALITIADGGTGASSFAATNGVVYVGASNLLGTALGGAGTLLAGTGTAPAFTATPTITSITLSGLTINSVPFVGTAGLITQNNTRFYWDDTALPSGGLNVKDAVIFQGATSGSVGLRAPGTLGDGSIYSLPAANGSNDQVLTILDSTTKTLIWKSASSLMSGITTVNGEDGPAITLAVGSTGTDFAIAVTADTVTFNLPTAGSGISRGLLTSGTQTIFGAKTLNDPLTFPAGTTTTTPFNLQAGAVLTAAVAHSFEWDGSHAFFTQAGPTTRQQVAYTTAVGSETVALATNFTGNLTGDVTSVAMATTYNAIVPLAKGGTSASLVIGAAGTFLRSDGAVVAFSADGSALTSLNASELASGTVPAARLSGVELTANKDAANGYAGLTAGTKLNLAQMQEVMASTDLSDFATKNGSGTAILGCTINLGTLIAGQILQYDGAAWVNAAAGAATAHNLLDASVHPDTAAATVAQGSLVYGNNTPKWDSLPVGAVNTFLHSNGTQIAWAQVALAADVTGVLAIANGGTGQATKTAGFDALSPLTTNGDIIVFNGTNNIRIGVGALGSVLIVDPAGVTPKIKWGTVDLTSANAVSGILDVANGGIGTSDSNGAYKSLPTEYSNTTSANANTANQVVVFRFRLDDRLVVNKIIVSIGSPVAATIGFGIYTGDGNTLVVDSGPVVAASGVNSKTLASPVTLAPGYYYEAWTSTGGTTTWNGPGANALFSNMLNSGTVQIGTAANASAGGQLPSTLGTVTGVSKSPSFMKLQN